MMNIEITKLNSCGNIICFVHFRMRARYIPFQFQLGKNADSKNKKLDGKRS